MKIAVEGNHNLVTMSEKEVKAFKRTWPASGLPSFAITFVFDKQTDDLVDILPMSVDQYDIDREALNILIQYARDYLRGEIWAQENPSSPRRKSKVRKALDLVNAGYSIEYAIQEYLLSMSEVRQLRELISRQRKD